MQSMHRQFGKFMKRTADESQVSVLLKDFDDADQLLAKIIEASKAWRDAWSSILSYQCRLVNEFDGLYAPIIGSSDSPSKHEPAITPEETVDRTKRLSDEYGELRTDLLEEVNMVDERMIKPAIEARDYLQPIKKTIKKREDKKLDFERYQGRVDASRKKVKRSDRDNSILAKAETDLERAKDDYNAADDHLRSHLPQLISVTFSLLPHLLATQISIQNTLLAHYYTMLHNYCEQENFPSPPPPMEQICQAWEDAFTPIQREFEAISIVTPARNMRHGRSSEEKGLGANGFNNRRPSNQSSMRKPSVSPARHIPPSPNLASKPKLNDIPPSSSSTLSPPGMKTSPPASNYSAPSSTGAVSPELSSYQIGYSPAGPRTDYFSRDRQPSGTNHSGTNHSGFLSASTPSSVAASIAAKKKPPPPPPRSPSANRAAFVTALYDFGGQGDGDLVFREGDRIRVIKKTDSTDDWWEGELRGVKGSFPANYCE
ncbi:hypothetical protein FQN54_007653 [Arachnomyces sp. PD_36]|nr:hypothetical protein FQN54_007653 [Arachnomyces sp. PD_36]